MSAQAAAVCGGDYSTASPDPGHSPNGYRRRDLDTRVGTIDVATPKRREGSCCPNWLLERRRRAVRVRFPSPALSVKKGVRVFPGLLLHSVEQRARDPSIHGARGSEVSHGVR